MQVTSLISFLSVDQAGKDPDLYPSPLALADVASHRTEGSYLCSRVHIHALGEHIGVGDEPHEIVDIAFNAAGNARILDLHGRLAPVMQRCSMHLFTQHSVYWNSCKNVLLPLCADSCELSRVAGEIGQIGSAQDLCLHSEQALATQTFGQVKHCIRGMARELAECTHLAD